MDKRQKINLLSAIILTGLAASVIFHCILGFYKGFVYPYNTFLFIPADRFNDFFNTYNHSKQLNPYFSDYWFTAIIIRLPMSLCMYLLCCNPGALLSSLI